MGERARDENCEKVKRNFRSRKIHVFPSVKACKSLETNPWKAILFSSPAAKFTSLILLTSNIEAFCGMFFCQRMKEIAGPGKSRSLGLEGCLTYKNPPPPLGPYRRPTPRVLAGS